MGIARPALLGAALLSSLLLAACSSAPKEPEWTHASKDELELRTDQEDCKRFFGSSDRSVDQCLEAKGWKRTRRR